MAELPGEYVGRPGERVFVVSRYDLVNQVLLDWRTFSSRFGSPNFAPPTHLRAQLEEGRNLRMEEMISIIQQLVVAGTNLGMFRVATKDTELNGVEIPARSTMWVLFGSSNRDTAHLGFGRGVHYCLGAPLARLEAAIALRTLAQWFRAPEVVDPASLSYAPSCRLGGLAGLWVRLAPR